jgi:hypothetical protein
MMTGGGGNPADVGIPNPKDISKKSYLIGSGSASKYIKSLIRTTGD